MDDIESENFVTSPVIAVFIILEKKKATSTLIDTISLRTVHTLNAHNLEDMQKMYFFKKIHPTCFFLFPIHSTHHNCALSLPTFLAVKEAK